MNRAMHDFSNQISHEIVIVEPDKYLEEVVQGRFPVVLAAPGTGAPAEGSLRFNTAALLKKAKVPVIFLPTAHFCSPL